MTYLMTHHREFLSSCGISEEVIRRSGVFTTVSEHVAELLLRATAPEAIGVVFPYWTESGRNTWLRIMLEGPLPLFPHTKPGPVEAPSGLRAELYIWPPQAEAIARSKAALKLHTDEISTLASISRGDLAIGLPGLCGWMLPPKREMNADTIPSLADIPWDGRYVEMGCPSPYETEESDRSARHSLVDWLLARGAEVKLVREPCDTSPANGGGGLAALTGSE